MTVLLARLEAVFSALLPLSLAAAAAAMAVAAVVWFLRRIGAPRAVSAALWLAVLVRLVCPVGLPVSISLPEPQAQVVQLAPPTIVPEQSASGPVALMVPAQSPSRPEDAAPQALTLYRAAALLWLAGALALLLRAAWQAARLRRSLRFAYKEQAPDGTVFYTAETVAAPFVLGSLRPRIYLPVGLSTADRSAVLAHEQAHLRRGDHLLRPVFYLAVCLHWFNPAAWWAFRAFCRETEAACDEAALHRLGEAAKPDYCRVLLRFADIKDLSPTLAAFAPDDLVARVSAVLRWKRPRRWLTAVSAALAALVFTACMAQPTVQPEEQLLAASSEPAAILPADTADSQPQTAEIEWLWPVPEYRDVSQWAGTNEQSNNLHRGVDICAEQGAAILASADGVVVEAGWDAVDSGWGYCLLIDHGDGRETRYAHCRELLVEAGDEVTAGQIIAAVGSTGRSTGNHLHWELWVNGEAILPQDVFPDHWNE